ncbi:MAG TPA: PhzF family phenazine biosynthesis protein [Solirubrobacterales bacterium]|nr:PhzF family phenazine biosynthesis protein [Solirubrobacterales bacterium]
MPELNVLRVFCGDDGSCGNPLGVFLDGGSVPEADRQAVAADLGFSETVFVDDAERGEIRIFTPAVEIPFAGHPVVGTAWLLARERGGVPVLRPPAGEVPVRTEAEMTYAAGRPEWAPEFEFVQLGSPAEVEALDGSPRKDAEVGMWAWIDEEAGVLRERVFAEPFGIPEDEATGAAAVTLTARLGRALDIRQGRGSRIQTRPLEDGMVEIAGRVEFEEVRDYGS